MFYWSILIFANFIAKYILLALWRVLLVTSARLSTVSDICYIVLTGIITLGDALQEDAEGIAVITMSAVLWSFLGVFPFIQVGYTIPIACCS